MVRPVDIFPSTVSSRVRPLHHPETQFFFRNLFAELTVKCFICFLKNNKIYHKEQKLDEKWSQHFVAIGRDSGCMNDFRPECMTWDRIWKRLMRGTAAKKNADVRACFTYGHNAFLVKSHFTFGVRKVEEGHHHVVQTTQAPLLLYVMKAVSKRVSCASQTIRSFQMADECCYHKYVLRPSSTYRIPEGRLYVLVAVQKTLFSLHRIRGLPTFLTRRYDESFPDGGYAVPATPCIDSVLSDEEPSSPPPDYSERPFAPTVAYLTTDASTAPTYEEVSEPSDTPATSDTTVYDVAPQAATSDTTV